MTATLTWLSSWLTGSPLQIGILVSLFWAALIVAILAIMGSNRRSRDMHAADVYDIHRASAPMPIEPDSAWRNKGVM